MYMKFTKENNPNKKWIGKTYEEIFGVEKAKQMKEKRRQQWLKNNPATKRKGKSDVEWIGKEKAQQRASKISEGRIAENNPNWKGDNVGYAALHGWIKRRKPKPLLCEECNKKKAFDLANKDHKYKRDVNDYRWLCRSCHQKYDYKKGIRDLEVMKKMREVYKEKCKKPNQTKPMF